MRKIFYFSSSITSVPTLTYLDRHLRKEYQTLLLHIGSLTVPYYSSDIDISWYRKGEYEQVVQGIKCKDVAAYNGMTIFDILKKESPQLVIMDTITHLQNRIVTVACKRLQIKAIYIMHGVQIDVEEAKFLVHELVEANKFKILLRLKKIPKILRLLYEYQSASKNLVDTIQIAYQLISSPFTFIWKSKPHHSLRVDKALVYSKLDTRWFLEISKLPIKNIVMIGCPKLDWTVSFSKQEKTDYIPWPRLLYIEQFLNQWGIFKDAEQRELLMFLKETASKNNLEFVVRLHPTTNRSRFIQKFGVGYQFTPEYESLKDSLLQAKIVAGHHSTALLESLALRIPTISLLWYSSILSISVIGNDDVGIVRDKWAFEEKLRDFNERGWMQEDTRKLFFPRGEVLASESIVSEINTLLTNDVSMPD